MKLVGRRCVAAEVLACVLLLRQVSGAQRTQDHLLLGEAVNVAPLPGLTDKDVSVHAVCGVVGGPKFKCAVPRAPAGIGPMWANLSAPVVDLVAHAGNKHGCGAWPGGGRGVALVDGDGGRCGVRAVARKAAKAGFSALLLVQA